MHTFQPYPADMLELNPFTKIGKEWMLITAGDKNKAYAKVAECILNGTGCTPSGENFRKTVERAEKANSAAICYVLGKVYREGKIFAADPAKSRKYFELGAKRGDPQCQQELKKLRK